MPSGTLLPCEHQLATKRGVLEALNNTSGNIDQDRKRPRHQQHEGAAKACPASPAAQAPEQAEAAAPSPDVARGASVTAAEREADLLAALGPVIESQVREAVSRVRGGKSDPRKELRAICERLVQDLSTHQFTCLLYRFSSRGSSGAKNVLVQALCAALVQRQQADAARTAAGAAAGAAGEAEEGWDVSRSEGSDNGSGRTRKRSGKRVPALRVVLPALPECEELQAC